MVPQEVGHECEGVSTNWGIIVGSQQEVAHE